MLLVIFGAGSSYDSVPHLPALGAPREDRPPLANQLFDTRGIFVRLMERFKDCQPLVPMLRKAGTSVEKKLAEFQEQADTFPQLNRALGAIHYYLHFALWDCQHQWRTSHRGITNFATLLHEIERWRYENSEEVCFVTFNYDTMLEEAILQVLRLEVRTMDSYISWQNYSLFKLHGSVDWGRVVEGICDHEGRPIVSCEGVLDRVTPGSDAITDRYRLCNHDMISRSDPEESLYPALSIPVEKKDKFSCPHEHVTALEAQLRKVTKVITVGWRATEAEFLKIFQQANTLRPAGSAPTLDLLVVTAGKPGAEETLKNLALYNVISDPLLNLDRMAINGFTGLIDDLTVLTHYLRGGLR